MIDTYFIERAQFTSPHLSRFQTSARQIRSSLATSTYFNHTLTPLPLIFVENNVDSFRLYHQSSFVSSQITLLLITSALLILLSTALSAHFACLLRIITFGRVVSKRVTSLRQTPPVVHVPREIQLSAQGHAAYKKALDDHGDVVIIPRHGRMEYIVDYQHVRQVLTDSTSYSFEKAVSKMLHLEFMLWFKKGAFVQELDRLVQDGVSPRLSAIIDKISPIIDKESGQLLSRLEAGKDRIEIVDMYTWVHHAIAQAMVVLIFGEQYSSPKMTHYLMDVVVAISNIAGIYENTQGWKHFPRLWSFKTTIVAIFGTIIPKFVFGIVPLLWKNGNAHLNHGIDAEKTTEYTSFLDLLLAKHHDKVSGKLSLLKFIWCLVICLGIIFASIHQTAVVAVWCIFNLAKRQEDYLSELRQEISDMFPSTRKAHRVYRSKR